MQKFEERESVVLENNNQKIFGIFHRPLREKKCPAVLICHGLGGHKTGKYRLYVALSTLLSKAGIASFRLDFRGSGDSEGEFEDMTLDSEISDALKAIDFLCQNPYVDSSRIGMFGRSIGGAVALMAARRFGHIKSLAMWAPVFSGEQWVEKWSYLHTEGLNESQRRELMRINGQIPGYEFYKQLFSFKMEDELYDLRNAPLLHIHGEKDDVVEIGHADRYMKFRKDAKGENKFIRLAHSDHDFTHPEEQRFALQETCKWFMETL